MSSVPITAPQGEVAETRGHPILWGVRVALVVAFVDLFLKVLNGLGIPDIFEIYYERFQSAGILYQDGRQATGQIGELVVLVAVVALSFGFASLLAQPSFWMRGRMQAAAANPTVAAVTASTAVLLVWSVLVFALGPISGINIETTLKYTGGILFVLLLHALAFAYAGFAAATGDEAEARRRGALAGLICGVVVALIWGAFDFSAYDAMFATLAGVARLVVFAGLGYFAGMQGAALWLRDGAGRPKRARAPRAAGPRRFRLGGGVIWGAVGLLLLTVFLPKPFSPIDAVTGATDGERFTSFGVSLAEIWLVIMGSLAAAVALVLGLRAAWPSLKPIRSVIRQAVLYALAVGGIGERARSRGVTRLAIALALVSVFFWPHVDQYFLGPGSDSRVSILTTMGYYVILALGLNVVVGFAGLLDLGYVAFFAFGAYTWATIGAPQFQSIVNLAAKLDGFASFPQLLCSGSACVPWAWLFWAALLLGAAIAASFGILLGAPTLRLRGDYLAIVTLGFGEIVPIVFKNISGLTKGTNGIEGVPNPVLPLIAYPLSSATPFYYIILALIAVAVVCNLRLRDSRLGRAWVAIREDEIAAAASGINTVRTKLLAFATGAFFAGMAGVYTGSKLQIVSPDSFQFQNSIIYLAMVVLGGIGSIPGVIVGALVISGLNEYGLKTLNDIVGDPSSVFYFAHGIDFLSLRFLIFGGLLIIMMLLRPQGLIPSARRRAELKGEVAAQTQTPELDALDAAIGGPAYTEERIE